MLLTDGGTELAEDVFKKYNPKDKQVFMKGVQKKSNPKIKWIGIKKGVLKGKAGIYVKDVQKVSLKDSQKEIYVTDRVYLSS